MKHLAGQISRFLVAGTIGFAIDAGIVFIILTYSSLSPFLARVPAVFTAMLATWFLNRRYTFQMRDKKFLSSFPVYIMCNMGGFLINYATYALVLVTFPFMAAHPLAAVAVGSVTAMVFNFVSMRFYVFGRKEKE